MNNVIEFAPFYLKSGTTEAEFLAVSEVFQNDFLTKQKGYISRHLAQDGELWTDIIVWSTMDNAKNAMQNFINNSAAVAYCKLIDEERCCDVQHFKIIKSYKNKID